MSNLAESIFTRTPDEKTIVEDVYKKTNNQIVNSFQEIKKSSAELANIFGFMQNTPIDSLLSGTDGNLSLNPAALTDRLSGVFSDGYSKLKNMMSGMAEGKEVFFNTLNSAKTIIGDAKKTYVTINGIVQSVQTANLKDIGSVVRLIDEIGGKANFKFSADTKFGALMNGVLDEAGKLGIPNAFNAISSGLKQFQNITNHAKAIKDLARNAIPMALKRGDIGMFLDIIGEIGEHLVGKWYPGAVKDLARNDVNKGIPLDKNINNINGYNEYEGYRHVYDGIDPNWSHEVWGEHGGRIFSLKALTGASPKVKEVFIKGGRGSSNLDENAFACLRIFHENNPITVDSTISKMYPLSAGLFDKTKNKKR